MSKPPSLFKLPTEGMFKGDVLVPPKDLRISGLADMYDFGNTWPVPLFTYCTPGKPDEYRNQEQSYDGNTLEAVFYPDMRRDGTWELRKDCWLKFPTPTSRRRYEVGKTIGRLSAEALWLRSYLPYDQKALQKAANDWLRMHPASHPYSANLSEL